MRRRCIALAAMLAAATASAAPEHPDIVFVLIDSLKASGRNVSSIDSDGDGMPDVWELQFRLNPLDSSDAASDSDGDGMSNLDEFLRGRSPRARPLAASPSLLKSCTVVAP